MNTTAILHLIASYGYLAVLLLVALESMGMPVPGEATLMAAAVYAGTTHNLSLVLVIAAATVGAIVGDNVGYVIGRLGGYRVLQRYGHYVRLDERKLRLGYYLFSTHGGKVVFVGRFVAVLRIWAAFLAGTNRMEWRRFLIFNALGGVTWATLMATLAYYLGDHAASAGGIMPILSAVLAAILLGGVTLTLHRMQGRWQAEADRQPAERSYCLPMAS